MFIILPFSRSVHLRHKRFSGDTKRGNGNIARNASRSDILTLLRLLSADAKLAVFLYFVAIFCQMALLDLIHEQPDMSLRHVFVKVGHV